MRHYQRVTSRAETTRAVYVAALRLHRQRRPSGILPVPTPRQQAHGRGTTAAATKTRCPPRTETGPSFAVWIAQLAMSQMALT